MSEVTLKYLLFGEDRGASKAVKGVGEQAESAASKLSGAVGRMGSVVGGEVGELLDRAAQGMEAMGSRSDKLGKRLMGVGSVAVGAGLAMQQMASGDVEAQNRLAAAVEATGKSVDDYADQIDGLVESQVKWGNTDGDVKNALTKLVDAYKDPTLALERMQLATDLAAAKQISLGEAAGIVAKAHGGAGKIFKEFGIVVDQGADGAKNYEGALDQLATQLSGRAAASADSFAGKIREGKAWLDNAASAIAEKYGPAVTAAGSVVTAVGVVMDIWRARQAASAAATVLDTGATTANTGARIAHSMASKVAAAGAWAFNAAMAATPVGIILAAVAAIGFWAKAQEDAKQAGDDLAATLDRTTGAFTQASREWVASKMLKDVDAEDFKRFSEQFGISMDDVLKAAEEGATGIEQLKDRILAADPSGGWEAKPLLNALDAINRDGTRARLVAEQLRPAIGGTGSASADAARSIDGMTKAQREATSASDALAEAQGRLQDNMVSSRRANRDYEQALTDLKAAIKDNGRTLDTAAKAGRDNEAALDRVRDAALAAAKAALAQGDSVETAAAVMAKRRADFIAQATVLTGNERAAIALADKLGLTRGAVDSLSASIRQTPDGKAITITAEVAEAMARVSGFKSMLNSIPGQISVNAKLNAMDVPYGGARAGGGPVSPGRFYLVGEEGPELLFTGPSGGTVIPNRSLSGVASGGAGVTTVVVPVAIDGREIARATARINRQTGGALGLG